MGILCYELGGFGGVEAAAAEGSTCAACLSGRHLRCRGCACHMCRKPMRPRPKLERKAPVQKRVARSDVERFMEKVEKADGHWIWTPSSKQFRPKGRDPITAKRFAWLEWRGEAPQGRGRHGLHPSCGVARCVNPDHLTHGAAA